MCLHFSNISYTFQTNIHFSNRYTLFKQISLGVDKSKTNGLCSKIQSSFTSTVALIKLVAQLRILGLINKQNKQEKTNITIKEESRSISMTWPVSPYQELTRLKVL